MDEVSLKNIKQVIRSFDKPAEFTLVTVEANDGALWLCVYENEIMAYEYDVREAIFVYLEKIRTALQPTGLRVELIGRPGDPPK